MMPLVSVLMAAYNHEKFVADAVEGVCRQDYPRLELIVVDDGSSDGTYAVLCGLQRRCEMRFERVVFVTQENRGTCRTFNRLLSLAQGEFCLPMASDDQLMPHAVSALLAPMREEPSIGVTVGENTLMDGEGRDCFWAEGQRIVYSVQAATCRTLNEYIQRGTGVDRFGDCFGDYETLLHGNHVANGYLIRRSALEAMGPLTPEAPLEDYWMHLQLSKHVRYRSIRDVTFRYRWHATNTSRSRSRMVAMTRLTLEREAATAALPVGSSVARTLAEVMEIWRKRVAVVLAPETAEDLAEMESAVRRIDTVRDVFAFVCDDLRPLAERMLPDVEFLQNVDPVGSALATALAQIDLRGYGYVLCLGGVSAVGPNARNHWRRASFIRSARAWKRALDFFEDQAVDVVADCRSVTRGKMLGEMFVARASALSNGLPPLGKAVGWNAPLARLGAFCRHLLAIR